MKEYNICVYGRQPIKTSYTLKAEDEEQAMIIAEEMFFSDYPNAEISWNLTIMDN